MVYILFHAENGLYDVASVGLFKCAVNVLKGICGYDFVDREFTLLVKADKLGNECLRKGVALANAYNGAHIHEHVCSDVKMLDNAARSKREDFSVETGLPF